MMNKMMKKVAIALAAATVVIVAVSTSHAKVSFHYDSTESTSTTETKTVKDAQGNEYKVSHTIETENGEITNEYYENVPFEVENNTGKDIVALYIANTTDDTWGPNLLDTAYEGYVMVDGDAESGLTMGYNPDKTLLDIAIDMPDGTRTTFEGCSLKNVKDPTHFAMIFEANADGYQVTIE